MERPSVHPIPLELDTEGPGSLALPLEEETQAQRHFPWLNLVLFVLTIFTTLLAGALQQGLNIFTNPGALVVGIPFSFTLMTILLTHEMGHYLTSRYHRVGATLPYFIPAPSIIGTFGAFIRMTSPILSKRALLDIGASGPIAGFVVAIAAVAIGLHYSTVVETPALEGMKLGTPLIFSLISNVVIGSVPDGYDVLLHPIAFAGWIGLFVTALNLIPIGQLDGGHVVFAVFGRRHRTLSLLMIPTLILLGLYGWPGWFLWAVLPLIFGINHPPVLDGDIPLDRPRKIIGWISLLIFILTFTPTPFMF
jgi:membrane-associated protease RseP (regulator of RpoE activity)